MNIARRRTDEELAIAAQNGDDRAGDELAGRYMGEVSGAVRQYFLVGGNHEDVAGEACVGLVKAIRTFQGGKASFQRFAHRCARRDGDPAS